MRAVLIREEVSYILNILQAGLVVTIKLSMLVANLIYINNENSRIFQCIIVI